MATRTKSPAAALKSVDVNPDTGGANPDVLYTEGADTVIFVASRAGVLKFSDSKLFGKTTVPLKKGDNTLKLLDPAPPSRVRATYEVHGTVGKPRRLKKNKSLVNAASVTVTSGPHEIVVG